MKKILLVLEIALAAALIALDFFIPTVTVLLLAAVTMTLRKEPLRSLGFTRPETPLRMAGLTALSVLLWTGLQMVLFMPVLNRLFGQTQTLDAYENLKGNLPQLLLYLLFTWTLAAFGEETVYRCYLQKRIAGLFNHPAAGRIAAVFVSSALFGLAHSEQGIVGAVITFLDALFFSALFYAFKRNLWAPILAHGLSNTLGLLWFFFLGPIYGLW